MQNYAYCTFREEDKITKKLDRQYGRTPGRETLGQQKEKQGQDFAQLSTELTCDGHERRAAGRQVDSR